MSDEERSLIEKVRNLLLVSWDSCLSNSGLPEETYASVFEEAVELLNKVLEN